MAGDEDLARREYIDFESKLGEDCTGRPEPTKDMLYLRRELQCPNDMALKSQVKY